MQSHQRSGLQLKFHCPPVHPLSFKEAVVYDDSDFALYVAMFIFIIIIIASA